MNSYASNVYEEGYYFTSGNIPRALERYDEWKAWTAEHGLQWEGVGLDIEPEARFYEQIMENPWGLVTLLWRRLRDSERPQRAQTAYAALIEQIHADGYSVENYQFPLIADERRAGSTLLQRLLGLVDVRTNREVWMQYNSFIPTLGPGLLWSDGAEAQALAVGTTGGGRARPPAVLSVKLGGARTRPSSGLALLRRPVHPQPRRVRVAGLPGAAALFRLGPGSASA